MDESGSLNVELSSQDQGRLDRIRQQRSCNLRTFELMKQEFHDITNQLQMAGVELTGEEHESHEKTIGKKSFNANPKLGLDYLFESGVLERTPKAVANFFVEEAQTLSKTAIGSYIGEVRKNFNMQVLDEYSKLQSFSGQEFLTSLRRFLDSFQLPGESQKIDKILNSFANQYAVQNPSVFRNGHEAYVMAYAAILLNTTLHNSNAKNQNLPFSDEKKFVRTMLDLDSETQLSEELIRSVYHGIKAKPIRAADAVLGANGEPKDCVIRGWLWKQGGRVKSWKRRWFVLSEDSLYYFVSPERVHNKGIIPLENVSIRPSVDRIRENSFELFSRRDQLIRACKTDREGVIVTGNHTTYRMAAPNAQDFQAWFTALQSITERISMSRRGTSVPCFSSASASCILEAPIAGVSSGPGSPSDKVPVVESDIKTRSYSTNIAPVCLPSSVAAMASTSSRSTGAQTLHTSF